VLWPAAHELATRELRGVRVLELGAGTGRDGTGPDAYHTFAAFNVRLPDDTPRRVRMYTPASCDTPHSDARLVWNLGEIRRVGAETHFFSSGVEIGDRLVNVDVVTRDTFTVLDPEARDYYVPNLSPLCTTWYPETTTPPGRVPTRRAHRRPTGSPAAGLRSRSDHRSRVPPPGHVRGR